MTSQSAKAAAPASCGTSSRTPPDCRSPGPARPRSPASPLGEPRQRDQHAGALPPLAEGHAHLEAEAPAEGALAHVQSRAHMAGVTCMSGCRRNSTQSAASVRRAGQWHMQRQGFGARHFVQHEAHQRTVAPLPARRRPAIRSLPSATGAAAATRSAPGTGRPCAARHAARCRGCACSPPACARGAACRRESTRRAAAAPPTRRRRSPPPSRPWRRRATARAGGCACAAAWSGG
jgi:hypothetical protein